MLIKLYKILHVTCKNSKKSISNDMLPEVKVILYKNEQLLYHFKATHRLAALNYCALNSQRCQHSILSSLYVAKPMHLPVNFAADNAASCSTLVSNLSMYNTIFLSFKNSRKCICCRCVCVYLCMHLIDFSHVMPHKYSIFHVVSQRLYFAVVVFRFANHCVAHERERRRQ